MKLITYCILLFVVIGLVPVATADAPSQSFSGTPDGNNQTLFVFGGRVFDDITPVFFGSKEMNTMWFDPSMHMRKSNTIAYSYFDPIYHDFIHSTPEEGTWTVVATETAFNGAISDEGTVTFDVAQLPEFTFGSFISLIFSGALYFLMRRTVKGSVNVG